MTMLMNMALLTSIMALMTNHPLSLGMFLLVQVLIFSFMTGLIYNSFWIPYMLFLMMISGLLILFMYMTSIVSNKKFNVPTLMTPLSLLPIILLLNNSNSPSTHLSSYNSTEMMLSKFFNLPSTTLLVFSIFYLLMTLIVTVKIINMGSGSLRQKF